MDEPSPGDLATLALAERELFSLYVQYPEINFDPESAQKIPKSSDQFSSPSSNMGDRDDLASVQASNSTRHTTPLKHDMFSTGSSNEEEFTVFCMHLRRCDLPPQTVQFLSGIGARILRLGRCVIAEDGLPSDVASDITTVLLPQLRHSTQKIKERIDAIEYITELAPFNIVPTDVSLWSNYRQRISLISKNLSCPSQTELKLLNQLLQVFDAYVYNTYLQFKLKDASPLDYEFDNIVNTLYDALMALLSTYQKWCRAMQAFKAEYMIPIMRRLQDSSWIQREIEQMESGLEAARQTLSNGEVSVLGLVLQRDQIKATTKLAERRAKSSGSRVPAKTGAKLKREHTI